MTCGARWRRCITTLLGVGFVLARAGGAQAQSEQPDARTRALELLREAEQLASAGNASEACGKYGASVSLDAQLDALLPWASCLEKESKLASALQAFGDAVDVARRTGDPRLTSAEQAMARLRPRVSFLTIDVPAARRVPGINVECDGFRVGSSSWGVPLPIDPGRHVVVVRASGYRDFQIALEVKGEAEQPYVEVPLLDRVESPPPAVAAPAPAPAPVVASAAPVARAAHPDAAPEPAPAPSGLGRTRVIALVAGGASLISLGLATTYAIKTNDKLDERDAICPSGKGCAPGTNQHLASLTATARQYQRLEVTFFALAGATAGLAAGLWFWPRTERTERSAFVAPVLAPGAAGVVLGGRL